MGTQVQNNQALHLSGLSASHASSPQAVSSGNKGVLALVFEIMLGGLKMNKTTMESQIGQMGASEEAQLAIAEQMKDLASKQPKKIAGIPFGAIVDSIQVQHKGAIYQTQQTGVSSQVSTATSMLSAIASSIQGLSEVGKSDIQTATCVKTR